MKGRLGTVTARSSDSLDQILALAEQKKEQGKHLDALRQQREAEERRRQQEISRLKEEAFEKIAGQVNTDLAKYQKVALSKYAGDMKGAAWEAMVANYPEAKQVKKGDVERFLVVLGLTQYDGKVVTATQRIEQKAAAKRERERRRVEELAKVTWTDPRTGLMWAKQDNGQGIKWAAAKSYCENYSVGGVTGWRMPTKEELKTLVSYAKSSGYGSGGKTIADFLNREGFSNMRGEGWYWTSTLKDSSDAWCINFKVGQEVTDNLAYTYSRVLPVRSGR